MGANEHTVRFDDEDRARTLQLRDRVFWVIYDGSDEAAKQERLMLGGAVAVFLAAAIFLGSYFFLFIAVLLGVIMCMAERIDLDEEDGLGDNLLAHASPVAMGSVGGHGSVRRNPPPPPKQYEGNPALAVFGSMRFKGGRVLPEARALQLQLELRNIKLHIVDMSAGGDIDTEVFSGIEFCDTFLVFGTAEYGEDTGNPASTFYESKFAQT